MSASDLDIPNARAADAVISELEEQILSGELQDDPPLPAERDACAPFLEREMRRPALAFSLAVSLGVVAFARSRVLAISADIFGHIIGGDSGDVFRVFSIGGDLDYRWQIMRESTATEQGGDPEEIPEAIPVQVDEQGEGTIVMTSPECTRSEC